MWYAIADAMISRAFVSVILPAQRRYAIVLSAATTGSKFYQSFITAQSPYSRLCNYYKDAMHKIKREMLIY